MNSKHLIILAVALALLGGAYLAVRGNRVQPSARGERDLKPGDALAEGFDPGKVRTVRIAKSGRTVELARKPNEPWLIASLKNRRAKQENVIGLLNGLGAATVIEDRPGALDNFGLGEAKRMSLDVLGENGAPLARLYVGQSPAYGQCFVQRQGAQAVLLVNQDLEGVCGTHTEGETRELNNDYWYDLIVCRIRPTDVIEFAIKRGHELVRVQKTLPGQGPILPKTLEALKQEAEEEAKLSPEERKTRPRPVWWITEPEGLPVNDSNCAAVYNGVSELYSKGYADDVKPEELGLNPPRVRTRIVVRDGKSITFLLGKRFETFGILQVEGEPEAWKIEPFTYDSFVQPLERLKKEDLGAGANPNQASPAVLKPPEVPAIPEPAVPVRTEIPDAPPPATPAQLEQRKPKPPPAVLKTE